MKITTVKEQYQYCINHEYSYTAHCIRYLLVNGFAKLEDEFGTVDFSQVDQAKVQEMMEQEDEPIKVFSLKIDEYLWAFVFAADKEEATEFVKAEINQQPKNCIEYPMDIDMEKGNRILSFREMKVEYNSFPALVGYFETELVYRKGETT